MNKLNIYSAIMVVILLLMIVPVMGQNKVGTTSFQFLKITPDVRSVGMGEALISDFGSAQAVFTNPAGIAEVDKFDLTLAEVDWFIDTKIYTFAAAYSFKWGTLGAFATVLNYGDIEVTEVSHLGFNDDYTRYNPGVTGEVISPGAQVFGLAFARDLTNKFTFGLTSKYVREDLVRADASKVVFDGGLTYKTGYRSIVNGAALNHFGSDVQFLDEVTVDRTDPANPDSTYSGRVSGETYPLPQVFSFGASGYLFAPENALFFTAPNQKLLLSYVLTHPRDYAQQHNIGLEYSLLDVLFLRSGYKFNYDEEGLTFGFGLKLKGIRFDYAFDPFGELLDSVHRFSFGFSFK